MEHKFDKAKVRSISLDYENNYYELLEKSLEGKMNKTKISFQDQDILVFPRNSLLVSEKENKRFHEKSMKFKELRNLKIKGIFFSCLFPVKSVCKILKEINFPELSFAEIAGGLGSTSSYNLKNLKFSHYDIYEKLEIKALSIRNEISEYQNANLLEGDAEKILKETETLYDVVFFDATHHYEKDKRILEALQKHLKDTSVLIFHDYNIPDVKKLIDEYTNHTIYYIDKDGKYYKK